MPIELVAEYISDSFRKQVQHHGLTILEEEIIKGITIVQQKVNAYEKTLNGYDLDALKIFSDKVCPSPPGLVDL